MYQVGDKVIHPGHGGCVIDEIGPRSWKGQTNTFYTLHPLSDLNTKLMVPVKNAQSVGIRNAVSKNAAQSLLTEIADLETDWIKDHNQRKIFCHEILKSCDLRPLAGMVKTLMLREKTKDKLTISDRELLLLGKRKLVSELSLALEASYDEMEITISELVFSN